jgi:hypothetical protein
MTTLVRDIDNCPWSCNFDESDFHVIMPMVWSRIELAVHLRMVDRTVGFAYDKHAVGIAVIRKADGMQQTRRTASFSWRLRWRSPLMPSVR